jgi:hypothetical protein
MLLILPFVFHQKSGILRADEQVASTGGLGNEMV